MLAYIAILSLALSAAAEPFIVGIERVRGAPGPAHLSSWNAHTYNIDATRRNLLVKRFIVDYDRSTHGISEYRANLTRRQQGLDPPASSRTAKASPILITASAPQAEYAVGLDVFAPPGLPSVPLGYVVPVQTAGKTLRYMLDTTSHTTWTASHNCLSCPESKDRRLPDNIKMDGEPFAIEYATDASWVAGKLARVDLSFGEGLDLPGFTLGAALFRTSKWHGSPVDGYIGLGLSALRPDGKKGIPTPLEALKASGKISAAKMGFAFGRIEDGQTDGEVRGRASMQLYDPFHEHADLLWRARHLQVRSSRRPA